MEILAIFDRTEITDLATVIARYKTVFDAEEAILDIVRKSEYTVRIEEQDRVRDNLFKGFADAVRSAIHHFDPEKREAARGLKIALDSYGDVPNRTYDRETVAIFDILREFQTPVNSAKVSKLDLGDWLAELESENNAFFTLMQERYVESSQHSSLKMKAARRDTDDAYQLLLKAVEYNAEITGGLYMQVLNEINAVCIRYRNLLAIAEGKRKKPSEP